MKIITLLTAFVLATGMLFAQDLTVKYDIAMTSDDPQTSAQLGMMSGSTLSIYQKGEQSRIEMNMGGMMTTTTITDMSADKGVMLMDGMMGKLAVALDSLKEKAEKAKTDAPKVELVDETKTILGYKCKKAIVTIKTGDKDTQYTYWYTDKIKPSGSMGKYVQKGVPGLPLEYSMVLPQMTMTFTAKEVAQKINETKNMFSITIPDGYTKTTMDKLGSMGMK